MKGNFCPAIGIGSLYMKENTKQELEGLQICDLGLPFPM